MQPASEYIDRYREYTAWIAVIPALTVFLVAIISPRFTFVNKELGAMLSIVFMMVALFLFIFSDRYVRQIVFLEEINEEDMGKLYRKASIISGVAISLIGLISALLVGEPDAPLTSLSFAIISLSGLGSAWKRFCDKLTGKIALPGSQGKK